VCVCLEFLCEHWYKCVSFVPCVLINVKLSNNVSCHTTHRGLCAKEVTLYKPSETVRQSRSTRFVYYRMTVSTYVEWEVVFVCLHLHVCTVPIKTALLANDSEREIVCVRQRMCACTQAVEMVAVKGGLLGKRWLCPSVVDARCVLPTPTSSLPVPPLHPGDAPLHSSPSISMFQLPATMLTSTKGR